MFALLHKGIANRHHNQRNIVASDATVVEKRRSEALGAAHLILPDGVTLLDPHRAVFDGMLQGWRANQNSRNVTAHSILQRIQLIERFHTFTGEYPWNWEAQDVDAYWIHLRKGELAAMRDAALFKFVYA